MEINMDKMQQDVPKYIDILTLDKYSRLIEQIEAANWASSACSIQIYDWLEIERYGASN